MPFTRRNVQRTWQGPCRAESRRFGGFTLIRRMPMKIREVCPGMYRSVNTVFRNDSFL
jgi:hypothetical protein